MRTAQQLSFGGESAHPSRRWLIGLVLSGAGYAGLVRLESWMHAQLLHGRLGQDAWFGWIFLLESQILRVLFIVLGGLIALRACTDTIWAAVVCAAFGLLAYGTGSDLLAWGCAGLAMLCAVGTWERPAGMGSRPDA